MNRLLSKIYTSTQQYFSKGHPRSIQVKQHIVASFAIKGASIIIGFLLVPITLHYVSEEQYGIWLTLSSVIGWFTLFDIGLGHGLRNKLTEALAHDDLDMAKSLVSSTYAIISCIAGLLLFIFLVVNPLLDWSLILNVSDENADNLSLVALVTFSFFSTTFVLNLIHPVFLARQSPALVNLFNLVANFISLITILILARMTSGSLLYLALAVGVSPVLVLTFATIYFFRTRYREIAPSYKKIDKSLFRELSTLGFKFFLVGITGLVIFSTDNLIIVQMFGPSEVPPYQIAFKYFALITSVFTIVSVPFWSAYTESNVKGDITWILDTNQKLKRLWLLLTGLSIMMLYVSPWFYDLWVPEIDVPFLLSSMMCLYVIALAWGNIFVIYINGVGKVQLQIIISVVGALLNIPLSYIFAKPLGMGTAGIILASTICIGYGPLVAPIQFKKLTQKKATGIWNK